MADIGPSIPVGPAWPLRPGKPLETDNRRAPDKPDRDGRKKKQQGEDSDDDNRPHIDEYA